MSGQHYCLRWNNYQNNMTSVFHQLLQNEDFVDVTLACNDVSLKAHKVVLSACSVYFQRLLLENPCTHPTIIMPPDVCSADLKFIMEFVYKGEIDVTQTELQSLLKTADQLKIKGLCETSGNKNNLQLSPDYPGIISLEKRPRNCNENSEQFEIYKKYKYQKKRTELTSDAQELQHEKEPDKKDPFRFNEEVENGEPIDSREKEDRRRPEQSKPLNMSSHGIMTGQTIFAQFGVDTDDFPPEPPAPSAIPVGNLDLQDQSPTRTLLANNGSIHRTDISDLKYEIKKEVIDIKFETLRGYDQDSILEMDSHMSGGAERSLDGHDDQDHSMHSVLITPELMDLNGCNDISPSNNGHSDLQRGHIGGPKTWTQEDMDMALDALRNHNMSLTKASATYGIPSTTLWQRAHRLGIDTPKKEGPTKSWTEENLNSALDALRTGTISANKASKAFGIPSSTLYKIARREGIRLAAPFNAAPTTWTPEDLEKALESIRTGQTSVQKASTEFGIPTGTLYGRCKREGIELSRSNPTPWSEDAMGEALEAVRLGHMSINQAAIHYNLPYSSLYGRFKRGIKYDTDNLDVNSDSQSHLDGQGFSMEYLHSATQIQYQNQTNS